MSDTSNYTWSRFLRCGGAATATKSISLTAGTAQMYMPGTHHPIHLHDHSFGVISRNNCPIQYQEWQDAVLMSPEEKVETAFLADNSSDWMFHSHILAHQIAGMMGVIQFAAKENLT